MKKAIGALAVVGCVCAAFGVEISPILEGKLAAFSFTYDDGAYSHYTTALPMHLKYGLPATFLIITDRVEPGEIWLRLKPGEKGGTIYVRNQKNSDTSDVATWIPAAARGDVADDFKKAKLVIADRGVVAIGADIKFASVSVTANSKLDLHGQKVKVASATLGGTKLAAGTYTSEDGEISGFVLDSVGGGSLTVGGGFVLVVR